MSRGTVELSMPSRSGCHWFVSGLQHGVARSTINTLTFILSVRALCAHTAEGCDGIQKARERLCGMFVQLSNAGPNATVRKAGALAELSSFRAAKRSDSGFSVRNAVN